MFRPKQTVNRFCVGIVAPVVVTRRDEPHSVVDRSRLLQPVPGSVPPPPVARL